MKISVGIGTVRPNTLQAAIDSVRRQTWSDWELLIVGQGDDAAVRRVAEVAMAQDARIRYLHVTIPGLSRARNAVLLESTGDIIAFMDDDCEAREDWLATLAQCFEQEPDVDVIGGSLLLPAKARRWFASCPSWIAHEVLYDPVAHQYHAPRGWDWLGGNVALRRRIVERIGRFDEALGAGAPFAVAEDTDYKLRLEAAGVKMRTTPRSVVFHTYGYRYGLRNVLKLSRNYARGNGGLAGKLTLQGDARGREWVEQRLDECRAGWRRPLRWPAALRRAWHFTRAYKQCLRTYRFDPATGMLSMLDVPSRAAVPVAEHA